MCEEILWRSQIFLGLNFNLDKISGETEYKLAEYH